MNDTRTRAQRCSDKVAWFCGSWHFFTATVLLISVWCAWQAWRAFDPYPYILLNLFLTIISTLQGPLIMMSQNREMERDRAEFQEMRKKLDELHEMLSQLGKDQ